MRLRLRAAAFIALIFAGITCSEPSTGPRASASGDSARISFVPRFSPQAVAAYRTLAAAAIEIAEIHIVLTGPDGSTRDTVIAFPVGQDSAHIEIDVPPGSNGQPFTALIELRSADHTVLFSGIQIIIARPSGLPPLTPPAVLINYSGPGRNTRTVTVHPPDTTVVGTPTIAYRATGVDSSGSPTANLLVAFTSSDPTIATVTGTSNSTANVVSLGKRGTTTITATTPLGITGISRLTVVPAAARLVVVSGGGQTGLAASTLPQPFVVEAQGADNLPVPGTAITFRAVTAGGSVSQATPRIADAAGRASVTMTLGNTAGSYQYEAASGALTPVTVNQTATQPAATAIAIVSGNAQTDSTGRTLPLPLVVRVTDAFGAPVNGATVNWARLSGSGAVASASTTTAADGTASTTYTLGLTLGNDVISATLPSIAGPAGTVQFTATTIARGAGLITITAGGGQSGGPGSTLPAQVTARVADVNGNPLANQTVNWTASANGATFNPQSILTDAAGLARTTVTLGGAVGPVTITATSGTLTTTTTATIVVGAAASIQKAAGDNQSATVGTAVSVAPSVRLSDVAGNAVPGVNVVFTVSGGGGSATGTTATTNGAGVATVGAWTLGSVAGPNSLTATAGSLSAVFSATGVAGTGSVMAFISTPSTTAASGTPLSAQPVLQLKDALGNHVLTAGVVVSASITSGTGSLTGATATSAADGSVTFSGLTITGNPGNFTLSFASPGYTPLSSGTIAVSAGAAATIALNAGNGQSATVGSAVAIPPSVIVTDAGGNPVPGTVVTFGVITPGATISDGTTSGTTLNVTTNASGIAALASWTLGGTAQAYTLHATATGLAGTPVVFTANAVAGTGSALAFATAPPTTSTNGAALSPQPVVQLKDVNGNNVTTAGVVVSAALVSGSGTLSNASATTLSGGAATFAGLAITGTVGQYTIAFSSPGYTTLTAAPITLATGPAATIALNAGAGQSAAVGTAVAIPPSVLVTDASGNPVAGTVVTYDVVTAGATVSNGTTSGSTVSVTTNASGIAALASWTLGNTIQTYTLHAAAANVSGSPVVFQANAVAGAGTQLAFVTPPASTATNGAALNPQPVVQLKDANGNNVSTAGVVITIATSGSHSLTNAAATTNASGTATFSGFAMTGNAGTWNLSFSAPGYAALPSPITLTAGPAASFAVAGNNQSAAAGSAVPVAPLVLVSDASNNPVAGVVVTFSVVTPGSIVANASTSGTSVTVTTNASGIASLTSWTLGSTAQVYQMSAAVPGVPSSPAIFTATATSGAAATIALNAGNGQSATVGTAVAVPPSVRVSDASNNPVAGVVVTFTSTTAGATIANATTSGTSLTVTTDAAGIAALSSWTLGTTAQSYALTAAASGLSGSPVGFTATATAGSGSSLAFNPAPSPNTSSGLPIAQQPGVQLRDSFGNPIRTAGVVVTAAITSGSGSLTNATATTNTFGTAQFNNLTITGTAGAFTLEFTAPGYAALQASVTVFHGTAANLALNAGNGQTTTAGSAVPVAPSVLVTDASGNRVAGIAVTFSIVTSGATVSNGTTSGATVSVNTDVNGLATLASWTLGTVAQPYTMTASVAGLSGSPVTFTATATAASGNQLDLIQAPSTAATNGMPLSVQPVIQLRDSFGNPVPTPGVVVTATPSSGGVSATNATATSNASGVVTFSGLTFTGTAGVFNLNFSSPGYGTVTFSPINLSAGAAASLALSAGNGQTAPAGSPVSVAPAVLVTDISGNPVAGTVVTFAVGTPGSVVANSSTSGNTVTVTTGANGIATLTSWTLGSTAQPYSMSASVSGLTGSPVNFTATATAGSAANITLNAGGTQSGTVGTPVAVDPSVRVTDANGNPIAGTTVTFAIVTPGSVVDNGTTFGPSVTVTTDAAGIATLNAWTLGTTAQLYTMNATSPGLTGSPVQFSATASAGAAANIAVQSGNGQSAVVGSSVSIPPAVRVTDQFGNAVAGTVVTFNAVTAGSSIANASTTGTTLTVTTNAAGVAQLNSWTLGNTVGTYTLTAAASGLTGSPVTFTANATPATGSDLSFTQPPPSSATSGVALSPQPSVQLRDGFGNPVSTSGVVISAQITSGNGSLTGATATTNASGLATFSGLTITGQVGNFTLNFAASGYNSLPFGPVALSAGSAAGMGLSAGDNQTASVDTNVPIAPAVIVHDSFGNTVAGVVVTFSAVTGNGSSVSNGTTTAGSVTVSTNASGIATLTSWHLGTVAQAYSMTASVSGLSGSPVTFNATATPGPQASFAIAAGQGQSAAVGTAVATPPSVRVLDAFGNGVAGSVVNFTAVPASTVSNGTTSGTSVSVTTNATGFATLASWTLGNTVQQYNLDVTVNGLTGTLQFNATATAGSGSVLAFTQQPSSSATSGVALATQPIVQVRDSFGNPVSAPSVLIVATISSGSGTLTSASATTNASGTATFSGLAINGQAGNFTLQFNGGGFTPVSFGPIAVSAGSAANIALNGGNGQTAPVGTAVATNPSVLVTDSFGNPVAGTVVTFAAVTGNGSTVSNSSGPGPSVTVTTNASGIAAVTAWTLGTVAQQYTLTATATGLSGSPVTFTATATAGSLAALQIIAGDNQTATVGTAVPVDPWVRAVDANGNGVAGVAVTYTVGQTSSLVSNGTTSGTSVVVTTDAGGNATLASWTMGTASGLYTLDATATGVSAVQFSSFATAGSGSQLTLTQAPSTSLSSGQVFPTQPVVQLRDGFNNLVSTAGVQVSAQVTSGTGSLSNASVLTDSNGEANFTNLTLTGTAGNFNIEFVASGYTPLPFGPITLSSGTAANIAMQAGNNQSVQWGQPVPIDPAVLVTDAAGNPVQGITVTFTPVTTGGQVQNSSTSSTGPLPVVTNAQGIAALDAFYVGNQAGNYTLTAAAAGLNGSPVTFTETALAGPFTHIAFNTVPSPTGQSGVALVTQPVIELRDAAGNVVPQANMAITATFVSGTGTFTNGTATTDATGRAFFSGFAVNGVAGSYTIGFTAPQLPGVSAPLTLSVGPAAAIVNNVTGSTTVTNNVAFPTAPQVRLQDSGGNNVNASGVTITATVFQGNGTVTAGGTATTNAGVATFTGITLSGQVGTYRITYSSGSLTPFTGGNITLNAGSAAQIVPFSTQNQSATQSIVSTTSIPSYAPVGPQARVVDVSGNGVAGVIVTFRTSSAGAFIQTTTTSGGPNTNVQATTNANGVARVVSWQVGTAVRIDTVTASAGTTTALPGSPVSFLTNVVANNGNILSFTTGPSTTNTSGALFGTQPIVRLRNAQGQFLSIANVPVTIFITTNSNHVLSGTTTVLTNSIGTATFTDLVVTGSPGTVTLRAASPGYTANPQSYFITIQ